MGYVYDVNEIWIWTCDGNSSDGSLLDTWNGTACLSGSLMY